MLQETPETVIYRPENHYIDAVMQELQTVPESIMGEYIDSKISFYDGLLHHFNSQAQRDKELIGELQKSYAYLLEEKTKFYANQTLQS